MNFTAKIRHSPGGFIERTLNRLSAAMEHAATAEQSGNGAGFLQKVDPRVKLIGLLLLVFAAAASQRASVTLGIFCVGAVLALSSGRAVSEAVARLLGGIFIFTAFIAAPALFTTPGTALFHVPWTHWPITDHGLRSTINLIARAETTASLAALMVFTTPWMHLLKALRIVRAPAILIVILGMTHRYIFVLLQIARDFFESRRARQVGPLPGWQRRRVATASTGALLSKSVQLSSEVYEAMQARGFRGNVQTVDEFRMSLLDGCILLVFVLFSAAAFWLGRL